MGAEKVRRIFFDGFAGALIDKDNIHVNYEYIQKSYHFNSCSEN